MSARRLVRSVRSCARVVLLGMLLALPRQLLAHTHLVRSTPAAGGRLASAPSQIVLWFNEKPELAFSAISLAGVDGTHIALGKLDRLSGSDEHAIRAEITGALAHGRYTVTWETAGADGHVAHGHFSFEILPPPTGVAPSQIAPDTQLPASDTQPGAAAKMTQPEPDETPDVNSPWYVFVRWLTFCAILVMVGSIALRQVVLLPMARSADATRTGAVATIATRAASLGAIVSAALILFAIARLNAQWRAIYAVSTTSPGFSLAAILTQTTWGRGWLIQVAAAVASVASFVLARRQVRLGWVLAGLSVAVAAFTPALSGHAAAAAQGTAVAVLVDGLHVLGAGAWLGTLFVLLVVAIPAALRNTTDGGVPLVSELVNRYSVLALSSTAVILLTGLFSAYVHLGTVAALTNSTYGRVLVRKLVVLIPVALTGAYNWRRVRPSLGTLNATRLLRSSAGAEIVIGAIVVAVTAVLVGTQPPR